MIGAEIKPQKRKRKIESPVSMVILSKGAYKSKAVMVFPAEFINFVVDKMSGGEQLDGEDRDAYFKEYMNICFGRFISKINNEIGVSSRFVIPVVIHGLYRETAEYEYKNKVVLGFMSEHGMIEATIKYEVLPVHASN